MNINQSILNLHFRIKFINLPTYQLISNQNVKKLSATVQIVQRETLLYTFWMFYKFLQQSNFVHQLNRRLMLTEQQIGKNTLSSNLITFQTKPTKMHQTYLKAQAQQKSLKNCLSLKSLNHNRKIKISRARQGSRSKNMEQLHYMIYNNFKNQKVLQKIEISNIKQFLKIEKAPMVQKNISPLENIKNIHIRYSNIKSRRQSNLRELVTSSRQSRKSNEYFNHLITSQSRFFSNQSKQFFQFRLNKYLQKIKETCKKQQLTYKQVYNYSQLLKYSVEGGNNSGIVEMAFIKRWWWTATSTGQPSTFVRWTQLKHNKAQNQLNCCIIQNHLEFNKYLTSKVALYEVINKFPNKFIKVPKMFLIKEMNNLLQFKQRWGQKGQRTNILLKYLSQNKKKVWIIKQLSTQHHNKILKIVKNYEQISNIITPTSLLNSSFIVEQYIQRPFLYNGKKIHVKIFVLITKLDKKMYAYWYKDGYICIATQPYNQNDIDNPYVHFTSQNIQINHHKFGEEHMSNKIGFSMFQTYLNNQQQRKGGKFNEAEVKMKETALFYLSKLKAKIQKSQQSSFQLLQMNFILNEQLNPWLISIHTNPFVEQTCPLLQELFPNLIDDVLKLTIDLLIPPPFVWPQSKINLFSDSMLENKFQWLQLQTDGEQVKQFVFENQELIVEQIKLYQRIAEQIYPRLLTE